jgi:uncharacterized membrane protein
MTNVWNWKNYVSWVLAFSIVVFVTAYGLNIASTPNLTEFGDDIVAPQAAARPLALYLHIIFGPLALFVGMFQLLPRVRDKRMLHRWLGRFYVLCCNISAFGGLWMAVNSVAGPIAQTGFAALALAWFYTTNKAWFLARGGNYEAHRSMVLYSYALTFAAVSLRVQLPFVFIYQLNFLTYYTIIAWSCWVPNLLFMYWWQNRVIQA